MPDPSCLVRSAASASTIVRTPKSECLPLACPGVRLFVSPQHRLALATDRAALDRAVPARAMPAAPRSVAPDTGFPVPILPRGRDTKLNARVSLRDRKNYGSVFVGVTMSEQYVRFGFDQPSAPLSPLLRSFR